MKCKDCECCHLVSRRRWNSEIYAFQDIPVYECWGVKESFEITDINRECTEYPERRDKKVESYTKHICPYCGRELKDGEKNA